MEENEKNKFSPFADGAKLFGSMGTFGNTAAPNSLEILQSSFREILKDLKISPNAKDAVENNLNKICQDLSFFMSKFEKKKQKLVTAIDCSEIDSLNEEPQTEFDDVFEKLLLEIQKVNDKKNELLDKLKNCGLPSFEAKEIEKIENEAINPSHSFKIDLEPTKEIIQNYTEKKRIFDSLSKNQSEITQKSSTCDIPVKKMCTVFLPHHIYDEE